MAEGQDSPVYLVMGCRVDKERATQSQDVAATCPSRVALEVLLDRLEAPQYMQLLQALLVTDASHYLSVAMSIAASVPQQLWCLSLHVPRQQ